MSVPRLVDLATTLTGIGDGAGLGDDDLVAAIRTAGELRRLADAAGARLSATLAERCVSKDPNTPAVQRGHASAEALIAAEADLDRTEAFSWTRVGSACADRVALSGELLPAAHPRVAEALAAGELSLNAADRIIRTLDTASAHATPEQSEGFEHTLVAIAPGLSTRDLRTACQRVIDLVDPDGVEPTEDDLRQRSSLTIQQQDDGLTRIVALLHPEAAAYVMTALDSRTAPRRTPTFTADAVLAAGESADDRRPLARRRADALAGIARDALTLDTGQVAGAPVTVMVAMTLDQLEARTAGAAQIIGVDQPVSAGTARRLAAGAEIIPLVLGAESEILDQGRASRLATPAQRRALAHRDRGCIWCGAPPGWCEVAHLQSWASGGPTNLQSLALMCPFHHWLYDHEGWTVEWHGTVPWLIPPAHIDPARTPRRAGPVPAVA